MYVCVGMGVRVCVCVGMCVGVCVCVCVISTDTTGVINLQQAELAQKRVWQDKSATMLIASSSKSHEVRKKVKGKFIKNTQMYNARQKNSTHRQQTKIRRN